MSARVTRPLGLLISLVVLITGGLITAGVGGAPPARAAVEAPITVVIDRLTPVVPTEGDNLRIEGRLVNTTADVMADISMRLRLSSEPLTRRS